MVQLFAFILFSLICLILNSSLLKSTTSTTISSVTCCFAHDLVSVDAATLARRQKELEEKEKAEKLRNEERKKLAQSFYASIVTTAKLVCAHRLRSLFLSN